MTEAIPFSNSDENDPDQFLNKAKRILYQNVPHLTLDQIYIVWFSKTLQNWKALLSTSLPDGLYYEITYDGNKQQSYVDVYSKIQNVCVSDESLTNPNK